MSKVRIDDLEVRVKELNQNEMNSIFGGALYSTFNTSLTYRASVGPTCALCLGGLTVSKPEGNGDWTSGNEWMSGEDLL